MVTEPPLSGISGRDTPPPADFAIRSRQRKIAEAAYFKAERRGFAGGRELDDWLAAEQEVDRATRPVPSA
jgi:hypothetical protein